ncbi:MULTISPECIES: DUF4347 domain-containing protein [Calothrix]|uniref:DUF4347 domain-containing protein n=2 Tax=Calothrix TaxID=1186 RepID=A0ABR8AFG1_9CYAN|nr:MULTISPECIES: DUF4347 domain-containing protein [Calothrix]MBD2198648.1 DUF4347 domain-containing protein [Calothrix parietina FACHB-288]MBD2227051.1 DUF4347 domain-containing protein [Calothrix anomala FACHB-343]
MQESNFNPSSNNYLDKNSTLLNSLQNESYLAGSNPREILFISPDIPDYQTLVDATYSNIEVVTLDLSQNGVFQISQVLAQHQNLSAIHIVTHASDSNLQLGSTDLNSQTLTNYESNIAAWGNSLSEDGDILFYGCNLTASDEGVNLVKHLAEITKADIAASNDLTGSQQESGDWNFETKTGAIEANVAFSNNILTSYGAVFASLSGNISGTKEFGSIVAAGPVKNSDDVSVTGNVTLTGDVTIDVVGNFTIDDGFKISGDGDTIRDNLTINSTDKVTIGGFIGGGGFQNLTINAPKIEILGTGIVSTRLINETGTPNWLTDASTGNSGSVTLKASANAKDFPGIFLLSGVQGLINASPEIKVNGKLLSNSTGSFTAGDVTITGEDIEQRLAGVTLIFGFSDKKVEINLNGATIKGANVKVTANAQDYNPFSEEYPGSEFVQKMFIEPATNAAAYAIGNLTIPATVEVRGSKAEITVNSADIDASGIVEITTTATVDSSAKAISLAGTGKDTLLSRFAAAYGQAKGDAQTLIQGNTTIDAGGNVTISSNTSTTAKVLAQVYGNLNQTANIAQGADLTDAQTKASGKEKGFSVAVANTRTISKAVVDEGTIINTPGGNVSIKADGTVNSEGKAQTSIFIDGSAGVGIGVNFDDTDIEATANGRIIASGTSVGKNIDLSKVNSANDTIEIPNHGYKTGDQVVYDNGGGFSIGGVDVDNVKGGLVNGETYNVLVVDQNHIKLTKSNDAIDIDNSNVKTGVKHSFSPLNGFTFDPATAINFNSDRITIPTHGLTTGQKLVYGGDGGGEEPDELVAGNEYYAIVIDANTIQLAYTLDAAAFGNAIDFAGSGSGANHLFNYYVQTQKNQQNDSRDTITFNAANSINTSTDNIQLFESNGTTPKQHGFTTGQAVVYSSGSGTAPNQLTSGNQYYVIVVDDYNFQLATTPEAAALGQKIDFTGTGSGTAHTFNCYQQTSTTKSFNPTTNIDIANPNNTITITNHGLVNGQIVKYSSGTETAIGGLTNGRGYFAIVVDKDTIKLAETYQEATFSTPTAIDLTTGATGTAHSFTYGQDDDKITVTNHNFYTGQIVNYSEVTGGKEIGGLKDRGYFVIVVDANTIKLANTYQDAEDGIAINLDKSATGSLQSFTYMESPIQFDPKTSTINKDKNTFTIANHGFTVGQSLLYEVDPHVTTTQFLPVNISFDPSTETNLSLANAISVPDTLTIANHGLANNDVVTYLSGSQTIGGLTNNTQYKVQVIDADTIKLLNNSISAVIDLTSTGNGTLNKGAVVSTKNIASSGVNVLDTITIANHGLSNGDIVTYTKGSTIIGGLTNNTQYKVQVVDANTIKLLDATTSAVKDLTSVGNGSLTKGTTKLNITIDNVALAKITISAHGFKTGDIVTYTSGTNNIGGLTNNTQYLVKVLDANTIQLIDNSTRQFVNITSVGDGTLSKKELTVALNDAVTVPDTITIANHGFTTNDIVTYLPGTDPVIGGLTANQKYQVRVIDANTFELIDRDQFEVVDLTSTGGGTIRKVAVDLNANTITIESHGLEDGDVVTYQIGYLGEASTVIGGLTDSKQYQVKVVDENTIQLIDPNSPSTIVDLTSKGTGRLHNLRTSRSVIGSDTEIRGLSNGETYNAIVIDENTIQLAEDYVAALDSSPINLDTTGATGNQSFRTPGATSGIAIASNLSAKDNAVSKGSTGSSPKWRDLLANPALLATAASTAFANPGTGKDIIKGKDVTTNKNDANGKAITEKSPYQAMDANKGWSVGFSVSVNIFDHNVTTNIGTNANLKSDKDIAITSTIKQKLQVLVEAATSKEEYKNTVTKDGVDTTTEANALAIGIGVGVYTNTVRTNVYANGIDAGIDAKGKITITSTLDYPFLWDYKKDFNFKDKPVDATGNLALLVKDVLLDGSLGFPKRILNSFVTTKNKGGVELGKDDAGRSNGKTQFIKGGSWGVAIAADVGIYKNTSEAIVGSGAKINQTQSYWTDTQSVLVDAITKMTVLDAVGIIHLDLALDPAFRVKYKNDITEAVNFFGNVAKSGVGASILYQDISNTTTATIRDAARIHTGSLGEGLDVKAKEDIFWLEFAQGGGDAESYGFTGSGTGLTQVSNTIAQIGTGVTITGGAITVNAESINNRYSIVGSIQRTNSFGAGIAVAYHDIERNTKAIVGKDQDNSSQNLAASAINVTSIDLQAKNTGDLWLFSLAGAVATEPAPGVAKNSAPGATTSQFGVTVSGNIALNYIRDNAQAYINDSGNFTSSGDISIKAINDTFSGAFSGGFAVGGNSQKSPNIGLFGSYSRNEVRNTTKAFILNPNSVTGANITVSSENDVLIISGSVGLAGSKSSSTTGGTAVDVAGAVSQNVVDNTTEAFLQNTTVDATGNLKITADDNSNIYAIGGAFGIAISDSIGTTVLTQPPTGSTSVSVGVAVATNEIDNTIRAYVDDATVNNNTTTSGDVIVEAISNAKIFALTIGGSVSSTTSTVPTGGGLSIAGAGAGSGNTVKNKVHAFVANNSVVNTKTNPKLVKITATDTSTVEADAGGFGLAWSKALANSATSVSVGASASVNDIENNIKSYVDNSRIVAAGAITISANSTADIKALSMGGAVSVASSTTNLSGTFAGAGAGSGNKIKNTVEATIANLSNVSGVGDITLEAKDKSKIKADAGGVSIGVSLGSTSTSGSITVGASISTNDIENGIQAYVDKSAVNSSTGNVSITAKSEEAAGGNNIEALSIAGAIAASDGTTSVSLSGAGASSYNKIKNTILASIRNAADVDAKGDISVTATDTSKIKADGGGVAIALTRSSTTGVAGTIGASVAVNDIDNTIQAFIEDANTKVDSANGGVTVSATTTSTIDNFVLGGSIAASVSTGGTGVALAGSGASGDNEINNTIEAAIRDSAVVTAKEKVSILAKDTSEIISDAGGGSLAFTAGGNNSVAIAIGVAIANNTINNQVSAYIDNAKASSTSNNLEITADSDATITAKSVAVSIAIASGQSVGAGFSGGGAGATNVILSNTNAYINNSIIDNVGNLTLTAKSDNTIDADVVAIAGSVGVGTGGGGVAAAIGGSLARNYIGYEANGNKKTDAAQVRAYIQDSSINARGALSLTATATDTITADVGAGALAVAASSELAVSLVGAGAVAENKVAAKVKAFIDRDGATGISANSIALKADDTTINTARVGAASVGVSFSGTSSVAASIGVSLARNDIGNEVQAYIDNANNKVEAKNGSLTIEAFERSTITSNAVAVSVSVAVSTNLFSASLALTGAGAESTNIINNSVKAYVNNSIIETKGGNDKDIKLDAQSTSHISALAGAVGVAGSGGLIAASGAIGVSLARNLIGYDSITDDSGYGNEVVAYIKDSTATSTGDIKVYATNTDTIETVSFAGSVAISVGVVGLAVAGAGAESTSKMASNVHAYLENTQATAGVDLEVKATSDSQVTKAHTVGAAIAAVIGGGGAISVAASNVVNKIENNVQAYVKSSTAKTIQATTGNVLISADVANARVSNVTAVTASIAVDTSLSGFAFSGGGVGLYNTINNDVDAYITGPVTVNATKGNVNVLASEDAFLSSDATVITVAVSLISAALGVAIVENKINSTIQAWVDNDNATAWQPTNPATPLTTIINSVNTTVHADSVANIDKTLTAGVSAATVGIAGNESEANIQTAVKAFVEGTKLASTGDVEIKSTANNRARSSANGGAAGGLAVTAMVSHVNLGKGNDVNELEAILGDGTQVTAKNLKITATSTDDLLAESVAAGAGLVAAGGAKSTLNSDYATIGQIGDNTQITVQNLSILSKHTQDVDSAADSFSYGVGVGNGAGVDNDITSKANVDIGTNSSVTADTVIINAINRLNKDKFVNPQNQQLGPIGLVNSANLKSGSAGGGVLTVLESGTDIGTSTNPFEALVNIGNSTNITVNGTNANPGTLRIETLNEVTAYDLVIVESAGVYAMGVGLSRIDANTKAGVNLDGATLENKTGDVYLTSRTDSSLNPSANLFILGVGLPLVSAAVNAGDAKTTTNASNQIKVDDSIIKASDIRLYAGRDSFAVSNLIDSFANAEITTASLGFGISIPVLNATINETNKVDITGTTQLLALEDVNLVAKKGVGAGSGQRARTDGLVVNLAIPPYGFPLTPDASRPTIKASDNSISQVNIDTTTSIEAGINNKALVHIKPLDLRNSSGTLVEQLPDSKLGTLLTEAEKIALGLPEDAAYEYSRLDLDKIVFSISTGTVVQAIANANKGGTVGHYYQYKLPTTGAADDIVLQDEDFSNTARWTNLGTTLTAEQEAELAVYRSDVTITLKDQLKDKFYAIKPKDLDKISLSYANAGNLLLEQREKILAWIDNHAGNAEAIARYQVQLAEVEATLQELGLFETIQVNGQTVKAVKKELDIISVNLPNIYAAPGGIFIEADSMTASNFTSLVGSTLKAKAGAEIDILNQSPFAINVNDTIIRDNKRVTVVDGKYTVLQPGNVYVNNVLAGGESVSVTPNVTEVKYGDTVYRYKGTETTKLALSEISYDTDNNWEVSTTDASTFVEGTNKYIVERKIISIIQDSFADSAYDTGTIVLPSIDQDMYIIGDVVNEAGDLYINNKEGSINVSGEIRAENVTIQAARDFNLNSEDWFHTNQDPRQYIDYDGARSAVFNTGGNADSETYSDTANVGGQNLNTAINRNKSSILAQGAISVTARYLNVNGLIQSGVSTVTLNIAANFNPGTNTQSFVDDDGNVLAGISFGTENVPVNGYFDAAENAIVIEDIVPQGGKITLAGQIFSTGNGKLKVANGYANVDINNQSNYKLIVNRIDNSTNREGTITIVDTYNKANPKKVEYKVNGNNIQETTYTGTLVPAANGNISTINYTPVGSAISHTFSSDIKYQPTPGLQYTWTEGQEKTRVVINKYEQNSFNLLGFDWDELSADGIPPDTTETTFRDDQPLLESESLTSNNLVNLIKDTSQVRNIANNKIYRYIGDNASNVLLSTQNFADTTKWQDTNTTSITSITDPANNKFDSDILYTISYEQKTDNTVDLIKDISLVRDIATNKIYRYKGDNADIPLYTDFADITKWEDTGTTSTTSITNQANNKFDSNFVDTVNLVKDTTQIRDIASNKIYRYKGDNASVILYQNFADTNKWQDTGTTSTTSITDRAENKFDSNFINYTRVVENWTTGGGWLRKKTYHTKTTTTTGLKDFYTHKLKADNPIDIDFIQGTNTPNISIESEGDIYLQGNIESPDNGTVELESDNGSITSANNNAIFGAVTNIKVSGDFKAQIQGGTQTPINITADGDIELTVVSEDNNSNSLVVGNITSTNGNVTINAADGITAKDNTSLIKGNKVELIAEDGAIGSASQTIRVDSNANSGGLAAKADDNIYITETTGDLKLVEATSWDGDAAIESVNGDVRLETVNGSILDGIYELFSTTTVASSPNYQYLMSPGLRQFLYPDTDFLGFTQNSSAAETANIIADKVTLVAGGNNGQLGQISSAVTIDLTQGYAQLVDSQKQLLSIATAEDVAGVTYQIYEYIGSNATGVDISQGNFSNNNLWKKLTPDFITQSTRTSPQSVQISNGKTVLVQYADQDYGLYKYIGSTATLDLANQSYETPSLWQKVTTSHATNDNGTALQVIPNTTVVRDRNFIYRYVGATTTGVNLLGRDYANDSNWQDITFSQNANENRFDSSYTTVVEVIPNVTLVRDGNTIYRYVGSSKVNLKPSAVNYANNPDWQVDNTFELIENFVQNTSQNRFESNFRNQNKTLLTGQLVEDRFNVTHLTVQLRDDVNLQATDAVTIDAGKGVAVEATGTLQINHVKSGGDVSLQVAGAITDLNTDATAAITSFGDLVLKSEGAINSTTTNPLRIQVASSGRLSAEAVGDINIQQVATDATINNQSQTISDLYVSRVTAGGSVSIQVAEGDMTVGKVSAGNSVDLRAQSDIFDAFNDTNATVVNIFTGNVTAPATGNVYLQAGGDIGTSGNFLDVEIKAGNFSASVGNDVFLHSVASLNVADIVSTAGDVNLDVDGDVKIDPITATSGTVTINADGSIIDALDDDNSEINAVSIKLTAGGAIASAANPFDIDSSNATPGTVTATANGGVYLIETDGDLRVDSIKSQTADVTLLAKNGSILDANGDAVNIEGVNINLTATAGSIGEVTNDLEIDSAKPTDGKLKATATNNIYITEIVSGLNINSVDAAQGDVRLTVKETAATGEDLLLDGTAQVTAANGSVILRVGDNITTDANSLISAQQNITILGDYSNADTVGTTVSLNGQIIAANVLIQGEANADSITLRLQELVGNTSVLGGNGNDQIIVDRLPSLDKTRRDQSSRNNLTLDGQAGSDNYTVNITGSDTDYIINVFDTGADTLEDKLTVFGTSVADNFLLRAAEDRVNGVAFVAALHGNPFVDVERINYTLKLEKLNVNTQDGDDTVTLDDNWAETTISGGSGNDNFQVGQIFKSQRDAAAGVAAKDVFETVQTTRGYLSNGVSFTTTLDGDAGNDTFTVYRNKAVLNLNGGDNDDLFVIRAFAEEGSSDNNVTAGQGVDNIQYVVNAPVNLNGGDGNDTLKVIGTEFADKFVVTANAISGAGRTVNYTNIETVIIDGAEGDDEFYVLSTNTGVVTKLFGGLGSDRFSLGGDAPTVAAGTNSLPAQEGSHKVDGIQGQLIIDGYGGEGSTSLAEPVLLPNETNLLASTGKVIAYSAANNTMTVATADVLSLLNDLIGKTLEISRGNGLRRFWRIIGVTQNSDQTVLTLQNPSLPDPSWGTPDANTEYAINNLSPNFFVNEDETLDVVTAFNDGSTANTSGNLTANTLTGLGMGATGVTYNNFEVVEVLLGQGNDQLTVAKTADGAMTAIHGGGGDDTITVSDRGGLDSRGKDAPLAIFGDTTQDGSRYTDTANQVNPGFAYSFSNPGNDIINASVSTKNVSIYGGAGNDSITGSQAGDQIAGGSGDDNINGQGGADHIYGDAGFNLDTATRELTVPNVNSSVNTSRDALTVGNDSIDGGSGDNIILGDYGIITQTTGTSRILNTGNVIQVETANSASGGNDTIATGTGEDIVLGGNGNDTVNAGDGNNIVIGDSGKVTIPAGNVHRIETTDSNLGGGDTITTGSGEDIVLGGFASDNITTGTGNDIVLGDNGYVSYVETDNDPADIDRIKTTNVKDGGNDTINSGAGNDFVFGGVGNDQINAGDDNDLIFGDNGVVEGDVNANFLPLSTLTKPFTFTSIDTANTDAAGNSLGGNDSILAGAGKDIAIAGQGNDTVSGEAGDDDIIGGHNVAGGNDGNDILDGGTGNDAIAGDNASILRRGDALSPRIRTLNGQVIYDANGTAQVNGSSQINPTGVEERTITLFDHSDTPVANTFGNDSIAGGAQHDVIFGQLGDDTIQGDGAVSLNTTTASVEDFAGVGTDGDDYIEGNGGKDLIFGNLGQDDIVGGSSNLFSLTAPTQRPDDADTIFGGAGTDIARNDLGDQSANGHARDADYILGDNGNILRLVGNNGQFLTFSYDFYGSLKLIPRAIQLLDYTQGGATSDRGTADVLHGESGDDVIHGMTGNDVIFGEGQDDDIYGGTGSDRIYGGAGEDGILGDDGKIFTSRNGLTETLYGINTINAQTNISISGQFTGAWVYITGRLHKTVDLAAETLGGNDTIYGGLGDDFLHGGAGDDGISGAEAQAAFYNSNPVTNTNTLGYDPVTRKLAAYDANNPVAKIANFFLNFDAVDAAGNKINDGKDNIFGDWGNDWLVSGTQNDRLFGGLGDDVINADDNLDTNGGLNDQPDAPAFADRDFAFGGGGLDVLIANTGGDRLFDWNGEYNSYWVPFKNFGNPTVVRSPSPAIQQFLLALGKSSGADQTLTEPNGELGLTTSGENGSPRDPQNIKFNGQQDTQGAPEDDRATGLPLT